MLELVFHARESSESSPAGSRDRLSSSGAQGKLCLRSRIPGRERWHVSELEDNPPLAAAVELVLRSEEGIEEVRANPVTGRVLIRFRPELLPDSVESMLGRALAGGPMSGEEYAALIARRTPEDSFAEQLVKTELVCSAFRMVLFGAFCPLGVAATCALVLLHRRSPAHAQG